MKEDEIYKCQEVANPCNLEAEVRRISFLKEFTKSFFTVII
jgi:hypothetical protein